MRCEFVEFNGDWHKDCGRCGKAYGAHAKEDLSAFFTKDKRKPDGFDSTCKLCKADYRRKNKNKELARWMRYYSPGSENRKRAIVRGQTRRKHGRARDLYCVNCKVRRADEWHHIVYTTDGAVPLCHLCHDKM